MPTTLRDIAKVAGISVSTVSRILTGDEKKPASKETANRILALAREMGYIPNIEARRLKGLSTTNSEKVIGCLLASDRDSLRDPFFVSILEGVQAEATSHGFSVGYTFSFAEDSEASMQHVLATKVDGIVLLGRISDERLELIQNRYKNIVYAGINRLNRGFDEVVCDSYEATIAAIEYLISLGHRKIGFISSIPHPEHDNVINEYRYRAYLDAMARHGLNVSEDCIRRADFTAAAGYEQMTSLLKTGDRPTAIFCGNDSIAIGAMKAIRDCLLSVPGDISLIGVNDIEMAQFVQPPLTTVHVPTRELGSFAVKLLIDQINQTRAISCCTTLPFSLVIRESCRQL